MTTAEMKKWIVSASYEELLRKWRFEPSGSQWFQGELGEFFSQTMQVKKLSMSEAGPSQASKRVGWQLQPKG